MPAAGRRASARLLVVIDVDSTLIQDEVIELLADAAGSREAVAAVTDRAMQGELDFAASLRERVLTLAGLPETVVDDVHGRIRPTPGARELIAGVHAVGGVIGAVSGGFHELLDPLAGRLGLDRWSANRLEVSGGRLTGLVSGAIVDARAKADSLKAWASDLGVPPSRTIAIGDGANDLLMMAAAGLSIAFNAKPIVRAHAHVSIDTNDLGQVLALLGLRS